VKANRREFIIGAAVAAAASAAPAVASPASAVPFPAKAKPLPLAAIRLLPSDYATAVELDRTYLLDLSADRLLHNFLKYAGLPPKAEIYRGWESDTLSGHTLGHYMTALVCMYEQTGDGECRVRADYIVSELKRAQTARGTGYVGGLGRKRKDGTIVDGEEIFPEVKKGEIHSGGFDLNGSWSPLYTVHKLFAGLLDVNGSWGNATALEIATGLAEYFAGVFDALDDAQMQQMLNTEYGGLNESFAELSVRTGNDRWLKISERLYDKRVLDPLEAGQDKLANFHANTQVPKLVGLARIHEITGKPEPGNAALFFWTTVTEHHSYVIGGNADREYFSAPDTLAAHITEQTCEHCNTYNMLKLTRHVYSWDPNGSYFDYYERAHLNHVMAAQNRLKGGFTYMTPLMTGSRRGYSDPKSDEDFWCCVGTGMESHSKHGESIFWEGDGTLLVNLYIPAEATWATRNAKLRLDTKYPAQSESTVTIKSLPKSELFPIGLRVPAWSAGKAVVQVNGRKVNPALVKGYAVVERRWKEGDSVSITLQQDLRIESTPGDPNTIAVLRGPMVLAADLSPASEHWNNPDPAMVGDNLLGGFSPTGPDGVTYKTSGVVRPADLTFVPFFSQYDRRSAVYFKRFTEAAWKDEQTAYLAEQEHQRDIAARSVDVMHLGEMQPERDHNLTSETSYPVDYRGRQGRDARAGGFFEFTMQTKPGPLVLMATYWGEERGQTFDILIDNQLLATQQLKNDKPGKFFDVEYPVPEALTTGKASVRVRFVPHARSTAGPVFGLRLFTAKPAPPA